MKQLSVFIFVFWTAALHASDRNAGSITELNAIVREAKAGDHIFLEDGVYKDAEMKFNQVNGTENAPVTISARHAGKVFLEGNSSVSFSGKYIHIKNFIFRNGGHELKNRQVIEFRTSEKELASYCTVSDCEIDDFNNSVKTDVNTWVGIYGEYNVVERCLFRTKDNMGPTLVVWLENNKPAHHVISENYFLSRQNGAQADNGLESIRIGDSKTSFTDAHCVIAFNRFEDCDGEIEIISNKSCHNSYYHNTFYNCNGGLTLRHGNFTLCDGNYFDGSAKKLSYGIRFIGEGHVAINNYFKNLQGASHEAYRSPVSLLNGLVNSPLNGYYQVKNAVISDNVFVDCETPLIRVGAFSPKREGMRMAPDTVVIKNNLFISQTHAKGNILEIISPASHFIVSNNRVSKGYETREGLSEIGLQDGSSPRQNLQAHLADNNRVGADWVPPAIAIKIRGIKYTYSPIGKVGPLWLRPGGHKVK